MRTPVFSSELYFFEYHNSVLVLCSVVVIARQVCEAPHITNRLSGARVHCHHAREHITHRLKFQDIVPKSLDLESPFLPRRSSCGEVLQLVTAEDDSVDPGGLDEQKQRG